MARLHDNEKYDLSDAEKRDLIRLVRQGTALFSALRHSRESYSPNRVKPGTI